MSLIMMQCYICMHAGAVTSSIMQLSFINLAPKNFKLSCVHVQLMISSGSPGPSMSYISLV